jgi:hypothetical protein
VTDLKQLIDLHCADLGDDYPVIAAVLNALTVVDNPQTEPTAAPVPITLKTLLALVPAAEAAKIYALGGFVADLKIAIDAGDREYMAYLLSVAVAGAAISPETAGKLTPLLTATVAVDPPATIAGPSLASAAGLGTVSAAQCQAVLNA